MININDLKFEKMNGLIPAIIINEKNNQILMLGFMNREALVKTIEEKRVTFFSRSKNRLWTKGETSGNYLNLISIKKDCDNDSLLIKVDPVGNVCHTGQYSCFDEIEEENIYFLQTLYKLINSRKNGDSKNSYTSKLFEEGRNRILQKVGEEAVEVVIAGKNDDREEVINETSDLFYHLMVMLADQNIELNEVMNCLIKRHQK